jgi:hypothetical protein
LLFIALKWATKHAAIERFALQMLAKTAQIGPNAPFLGQILRGRCVAIG